MVVRIVYPGGHVELHDAPILAGEITARHPKCEVARPDVFRQPLSAVVSPDTTLMLGQKFYVVPTSTIRKLQRKFAKRNPNAGAAGAAAASSSPAVVDGNNIIPRYVYGNEKRAGGDPRRRKVGCFSCFTNLINGNVTKDKSGESYSFSNDDYRMGIVNWSGSGSDSSGSGSFGSPAEKFLAWNDSTKSNYYNNKKMKKKKRGSGGGARQPPKRGFGFDGWTPSLESITEE
ncbi:unnamed protein product [Linum trigynum]